MKKKEFWNRSDQRKSRGWEKNPARATRSYAAGKKYAILKKKPKKIIKETKAGETSDADLIMVAFSECWGK